MRSRVDTAQVARLGEKPPSLQGARSVTKEGNEAKFWLDPVKVAREGKFRKSDLRAIERIIADNL